MCGRYTHLYTWKQLHRLLALVSPEMLLSDRFNVAPTQSAPVVVFDDEVSGFVLRSMRWGLVPSWAKDILVGNSLINARAEGIESKPSFRAAFKRRRCIVPISGFYEWQKVEGEKAKQAYYITPAASKSGPVVGQSGDIHDPWLLAGLWEAWHDPRLPKDAPWLETFSIITTEANQAMAPIHNRMPVILDPANCQRWIGAGGGESGGSDLTALLRPCPPVWMAFQPVSSFVNSPRNDTPQCIQVACRQEFGNIFDQRD
jgi:putative SOS response-associated peptidase YedK